MEGAMRKRRRKAAMAGSERRIKDLGDLGASIVGPFTESDVFVIIFD